MSPKVYINIFDPLLDTVAKLRTKKQASVFFEEFFTPTEKVMLAKRLAIWILIAKRYSYREISELLKMSTSTIAVYCLSFKYKKAFRSVIERILKEEALETCFLEIIEGAAEIGSIGGAKSSDWFELKRDVQKKKHSKII